ncbi:MAG: hypothetical protein ABI167_11570 [Nitrosospira sp.]
MRKTIGWAASWALYYVSGYMDLARARYGARWILRLYVKLLNASDDMQTWGGGGGTWAPIVSEEDKREPYSQASHSICKRNENLYRRLGRLVRVQTNAITGRSKGLRRLSLH